MSNLQPRVPFIGPLEEGTRMIALTQGQYTKVPEDWYDRLMQWNWCASWNRGTKSFYAVRSVRKADGTKTTEQMHQRITGFRWRIVDHINHDTLDNLLPNMRDGTRHNQKHMKPRTFGTSQYHGVSWHKGRRKWQAQIKVGGKPIHLGFFDTELDAAIAYDEASRKYHGEHGTRNFPPTGGGQ